MTEYARLMGDTYGYESTEYIDAVADDIVSGAEALLREASEGWA